MLGDDLQLVAAQVQGVLYRSPRLYDQEQTRWSLPAVQRVVPWLGKLSQAGVCKLLKRLHVSYKRGQRHVHSPDLRYDEKLARIRQAFREARREPGRTVFLYQDEHTIGRNAAVARCFSATAAHGLPALQAARYNSMLRMAGCLDAVSGALITKRYSSMNVKNFIRYLRLVEEQYPQAERICIALDNWSVHINPAVQQDLQERHSKITLLFLPTYAPWCNPIEKVWLYFNEVVGDMHPYCENWSALLACIDAWLAQRRAPSQAMLRRVGLLPKDPQYSLFYNPI